MSFRLLPQDTITEMSRSKLPNVKRIDHFRKRTPVLMRNLLLDLAILIRL
jgi:hypothetical protein